MQNPLHWRVRLGALSTFAEFEITAADGSTDAQSILRHAELGAIGLPPELAGREPLGVILSGRGPVWLYAYLTHLLHSFAWLAVHDPRLGGAVVVSRHVPTAPSVGSVVRLP